MSNLDKLFAKHSFALAELREWPYEHAKYRAVLAVEAEIELAGGSVDYGINDDAAYVECECDK